jgi:hypothetical protein
MKDQKVPFVNNVKYLGVISDKKNHMEVKKRSPSRPYEYLLAFSPF